MPKKRLAEQIVDVLKDLRIASPKEIALEIPGANYSSVTNELRRMLGRGELAQPASGVYSLLQHENPQTTESDRVLKLEMRNYTARAGAASGGYENQYGVNGEYYIDSVEVVDLLGKGTRPLRPFSIEAAGDSMEPLIFSGERIVMVPTNIVYTDSVYLFRLENAIFLKRLQRLPGNLIKASSDNIVYEPFTIASDADLEIIGRLWGKFRRY